MLQRVAILIALALVLGVPLLAKLTSPGVEVPRNARRLVVITPNVPQIRSEFGEAFAAWHERTHGQPAQIDWRIPGGTSEIIKLLQSQFESAHRQGAFDWTNPENPIAPAGTIAYDLMFGGGSFDHGRLKTGIKVRVNGEERTLRLSTPAGFSAERMRGWFGNNRVGSQELADREQYWLGTALSSFGIVYNTDVLRDLGLPEPRRFEDLTDPRLAGSIILTDPRQSGSVTTTFDALLNAEVWNLAASEGWDQQLLAAFGEARTQRRPWYALLSPARQEATERAFQSAWRKLLDMCANSRTFTAAATKPPVDVSAGEGAAGLSIDFYGRGQAQSVGEFKDGVFVSRVGYTDPVGATYIDADPVSMLRGGPDPELAKRFVEFCMTDEAQALWNLPSQKDPRGANNPRTSDGRVLGPRQYELRRLPVTPSFYEKYRSHLIDQVDPFAVAAPHLPVGWRNAIAIIVGAGAIDTAPQQRAAWRAMQRLRALPESDERRTKAEALWRALPPTRIEAEPGTQERTLEFTAANMPTILDALGTPQKSRIEIEYTTFFRRNYDAIVALEGTIGR